MSSQVRIGDVFEIPLSDGRKSYGQYVHRDKMGPIIRVFNLILDSDQEIVLSSLDSTELLFPPIITGLFAAIRSGLWQKVGTLSTKDFHYQNFVSRMTDAGSVHKRPWFLWNGENSVALGYELPKDYRDLEHLIVWEPRNLVRRIETGENPYAYTD